MSIKMQICGLTVFGDYIVRCNGVVILTSFFDRAKNKVKACSAMMGKEKVVFSYRRFETKGSRYKTIFKPIILGRDRFIYTTCINWEVGNRFLITTEEDKGGDIYSYLMENYELPLKKEWSLQILQECIDKMLVVSDVFIEGNSERMVPVHGKKYPLSSLRIYDFSGLTENLLEDMVSEMLRNGKISFSPLPSKELSFSGFDDYITKYGSLLANNLSSTMASLSPLNGVVDGFAAMKKRMYPQQAACVNGIIALMESGSKYGFMVEGMGCGKTLQGASVIDAAMNRRWISKHPGKNLRDLYLSDDQPTYRAIVMMPGHLLNKWRDEILGEIPGANVTIIRNLDCLIKLREQGKQPKGRDWFLVSKDAAKLGVGESPIPTAVGREYITANYCVDCKEASNTTVYAVKQGNKRICPSCKGNHLARTQLNWIGKKYGMVCPYCHCLLIKGLGRKELQENDYSGTVLEPKDFAHHTSANSTCYVCGGTLWGANAKPVSNIPVKEKKQAWHKISHYKNEAKKSRVTSFVLRGHEEEFLKCNYAEEYEECASEYGPRRYALSRYIKKYLKGYFDICILDEVHKYEGGGTAQSNAAQSLVKASKFTLGLTGTISNGKADSFFYLLYILDSERMQKKGYGYEDVLKFSKDYGSVETVYEAVKDADVYNASSRGRMLRSPKTKPGISPLLFIDFLLDKGVFLDLADLSKFLPPLKEQVITVSLPDNVQHENGSVIRQLRDSIHSPEGGYGAMSSMLVFGLSYPDKPYGREPIMSGKVKDYVLAEPHNFEEYAEDDVLMPKEEELVRLINKEQAENRNCFVYCVYTGKAEMNILGRIESIIKKRCGLRSNEVTAMTSTFPAAEKREAWIHQKAAEGTKVFVCNYKLVETGLDFCFHHEGEFYNYPTIIFLQVSYELSVMWQASRRAYRLNQTAECRTYYLVYNMTAQMAALEVMAEKQVAASAIQGKFSVDGLSAMAKGIDPAIRIAQKLSENDIADRETLENMFDVLQKTQSSEDAELYDKFERALLFEELMEGTGYKMPSDTQEDTDELDIFDIVSNAHATDNVKKSDTAAENRNRETDILCMLNLTAIILDQDLHNAELKRRKKKRQRQVFDMEQSIFDLI